LSNKRRKWCIVCLRERTKEYGKKWAKEKFNTRAQLLRNAGLIGKPKKPKDPVTTALRRKWRLDWEARNPDKVRAARKKYREKRKQLLSLVESNAITPAEE
jgi:chromatin segregation and condensation protein Rec8/ScpA/Scc1 (kleisin family)